jgi:hypothetical protein
MKDGNKTGAIHEDSAASPVTPSRLHIRDQYEDGQWTEYVGQGVTDFTASAQALRNADFKGRAAVELAFPSHYVLKYPLTENWKRSIDYVRKVFGWQCSSNSGTQKKYL